MDEFLAGLACIVIGVVISLVIIGIAPVTIATASFWYWLPAIIGALLAAVIWTGGDVDFNPFD